MFLKTPEHIPAWMRPTYLVLSTILGMFLAFEILVIISLKFMADDSNTTLGLPIAPVWLILSLILGAIVGWLQGRVWWRWVYVERKWSKKA